MPLQRTRTPRFARRCSPLNGGSLGPTKRHAGSGFLVLALSSVVACASGGGNDRMVVAVVQRFTAEGFLHETTPSVLDIFSEDHTGRAVNVNNGVFWYSRDDRFAIQFEVEGCPPSGDPAVNAVVIYSQRRSRREAEADVWRWLIAAGSPTMPPRSISDERTHSYFEATWTRSGNLVHVKAWVSQSSTGSEWLGVVHLYPNEVIIVSLKRGA
jgi:hypothetical protein